MSTARTRERTTNVCRTGTPVAVYLPREITDQLDRIEERYGSSRSFLARKAFAYWLASDEARALLE